MNTPDSQKGEPSGNLFPVKLLHLFTELQRHGKLDHLAHHAAAFPVQAPADGLLRLMLCSPEVQKVVCAAQKTRMTRVRIAVPPDLDFLRLIDQAQFEVYGEDGAPLGKPVLLTKLEDSIANAVQVELFHTLLRAKGVDLPLL